MKIIADQQIPHVKSIFSDMGDITLMDGRETSSFHLKDADILLIRSVTKVDEFLLKDSQIKFIGSATSGIDHVDVDYLNQSNISFAYAHGCNAQSVAEYVLSCLFVIANRNEYKLQDKTVGIIGCGKVGSRVLKLLEIIGIKCMVNDPPLCDKTGDVMYCDINEVLESDIITIHVPFINDGNYPTRHMVDKHFLTQLKSDCLLINTSRGEVINESALKNHLQSNPAFLTVLDVWSNEPQIDDALLSNITIGTPHIAGYSMDGRIRAVEMIYEQACRFFGVDSNEQTKMSFFDDNCRVLIIEDELDISEVIQFAVLSHYDVRSDAAPLVKMREINEDKRRQYFDDLRNDYPVRREFSSTKVVLTTNRPAIARKLSKLGFSVTTH